MGLGLIKKLLVLLLFICVFGHSANSQVTANFSASITRSCVSTQVQFTDLSSSTNGAIIDWEWDLNGVFANKKNPSIIFTNPGGYDICLIAIDIDGNRDTLCKEDYVIIWEKPVASFTADIPNGCSPHQVTFTNTSTSLNGSIAEVIWDVGGSTNLVILDEADSMITSTYVSSGTYAASLLIKDDKGCTASVNVGEAVTVFPKPVIDYSFEVISGCDLPWEVNFSNILPDESTTYSWDFGNGQSYEGDNPPIITYDSVGMFDLTIALERNGCIDTIIDSGIISPGAAPDFNVAPLGACVNTSLTFSETSQISSDSIFWDFGDGTISELSTPTHTYTTADCYQVTMIRYSGDCIDTIVKPCLQINPSPNISAEIDNQFACSLPVQIGLTGLSDEPGSFTWTFKGLGEDKILFDDSTSLLVNQNGDFTIDLNYISDDGCMANIEDIPVTIETFEASIPNTTIEGCSPLNISLVDNISSNLDIISWNWSIIGNTNLSFDNENPNFIINDTGRYDVQLIVENEIGCIDTVFVEEYIKVGIPPEVNFIASPLEECILAPKNFTPFTSDFTDSWVWGTDGTDTLSTDQFPILYLNEATSWDISLTAYHNGCPNTFIREGYINILEPGVSYIIEYDCDDPYTITIDDRTTGADSSYWEIELGPNQRDTFFNTNLEEYTFPDRGKYFINHYAINYETGCEHYRIDTIIITDPIAIMTLDTLSGCAPLTINVIGESQDALQLEYVIPGATIDSSLSVLDPLLTYDESGPFLGPKLVITDYHGCQDSLQIIDSVLVNAATAIPGYSDAVCVPDSTKLFDLSTDRLGEIIERKWYFDNATIISEEESLFVQITENKFYNLSLAVTDDWGCKDSIHVSQSVYGSLLDPTFFTVDTLTCTQNSIIFFLQNEQQDIAEYLWDFGDGNTSTLSKPFHNYTTEGQYTVCLTINDIYNCPKSICLENYVTVLDPIANFSGDPLYEVCPPLITNFVNSSINTNIYSWSFGDNSGLSDLENPSHIYNEPGSFDVTLIANSTEKCADTLTINDYVVVDGPSGNFMFDSDSSCLPLTVSFLATSNDFYTFGWDFGNGETSFSNIPSMTDTVEYVYENIGAFSPKLILSDGNGCIRTFTSDTIYVNSLELDFTTNIESSCMLPTTISLENKSISSNPEISYTWNVVGNENFIFDTENTTFDINELGVYNVSLSAESANCIDTIQIDSLLKIGSVPVADFDLDSDQICEELLTIFQNNSTNEFGDILAFEWNFGDGVTSNQEEGEHIFTSSENNTISLLVTTEFGCTDYIEQTIQILPNIVPILPDDYTMCIGDSVQILAETIGSGLEETSFSWNEPNYLSCNDCLQPFANPEDTTMFIITSENSNGCIAYDTININVVPIAGPQLSLSKDTIICDMDTAFISISNFDSNLNYLWSQSPSLSCTDCQFANAYPEDDTYYTVTVSNEFGCFKTDSILVEVERSIDDFLIDEKGICEDSVTHLIIDNAVLNPIWQSDPSLSCINCYEVTAAPNQSQYYFVSVTSPAGCTYRDSTLVTVIADSTLTINDNGLICLGEEFPLSSSGMGTAEWSPNVNLGDHTMSNTICQPDETTIYTVTYTFDECIQRGDVFVEVIDKTEITATGDTICIDESAILSANGIVDEFLWYDSENNLLSQSDSLIYNTPISENLLVIGKYGLCEDDTAMVSIKVQPEIDVSINTFNYDLYINSAEVVDIDFDESANYSYYWSPSEGLSCDDCPDPKIKSIEQAMQYTLVVTDELTGCTLEEIISVRFISLCSEKAFYIPNIFSPNNDGINDRFKIIAERPEEFNEIRLFDRWGNQMYFSTDILDSWDGSYKGQLLMPGVYVYRIIYTCFETGEQLDIYGDVTVMR